MNTLTVSTFERYLALDVHKHYVVVGGVNAQQQVILPPRRLDPSTALRTGSGRVGSVVAKASAAHRRGRPRSDHQRLDLL